MDFCLPVRTADPRVGPTIDPGRDSEILKSNGKSSIESAEYAEAGKFEKVATLGTARVHGSNQF